jgi:hypothetical protein
MKERKFQYGTCPTCKKRFKLPLAADPTKVLCKKCFKESTLEPTMNLTNFLEKFKSDKERA